MIIGLKDSEAMNRNIVEKTYTIGWKEITFESGRLALFAQGSVVIKDTVWNFLLTTAWIGKPRDGDFFPLTVEYQEKYYASGKIWWNRFQKREGRPSEAAILNSRLIDRPIRPMFPSATRTEIQIISTIMSSSWVSDFGYMGITGASLSLLLSGIEGFEWPIAGVRIAIDTAWNCIFDPSFEEIAASRLDLTLAGTLDTITMVESQGKEVDNETMIQAFEFGQSIIRELCLAQKDFIETYTKFYTLPIHPITLAEENTELLTRLSGMITPEILKGFYNLGKTEFYEKYWNTVDNFANILAEEITTQNPAITLDEALKTVDTATIADALKSAIKHDMRANVLEKHIRLDGRKPSEVRPVRSSVGILPRTHGSGLFERGVTQVLSVTTLGGPSDIQIVDDMYEEDLKRYIHHYNFPPYSVGEVRPLRGVGRREVGHGRLAEKALEPVLPSEEEFPYMIRVVSETTTCNGSSSMASVCGSTLSLMDAGVPITAMVAGVAMGMIYDEETGKYVILSDIQAQEDFLGDMDFKVARTEKGITALQMDCKISGLSMDIIREVFSQSVDAISYIMNEMKKAISEPRAELSPYAPFLLTIFVPEEKMREVIGKGGETIQGIEKNFGVEVDLADDGHCTITAKTQEAGHKALDFIKNILRDIEVGDEYEGKIIKILDTVGAIVELGKWKEWMIHISKFGTPTRVNNVNDVAKVGDTIRVKVYNVDKEKGRIGLEKILSDEEKAIIAEARRIADEKRQAENMEKMESEAEKPENLESNRQNVDKVIGE